MTCSRHRSLRHSPFQAREAWTFPSIPYRPRSIGGGKPGRRRRRIASRPVPLGDGDRRKQLLYSAIPQRCQDYCDGRGVYPYDRRRHPTPDRMTLCREYPARRDGIMLAGGASCRIARYYSSITRRLTRSTVSRRYPSRRATTSRRMVMRSSSLANAVGRCLVSTDFR